MMAWYQSRDENYTSPIVRGMRRTKPSRRERILSGEEIRAVWRACDEIDGAFGALIKVLLLTAQRREKVASMRWADLKGGVWTVPEEERQKGTGGKLNLPTLALDAIEAQPHVVGNPHAFAARGKGSFNSFSQRKEELDHKLSGMEPWTLHDLRRTARSLMSRAGVRPDIAERVLGHAIAGVEGVYDRHRYDAEKADALNKLAHLIETIIKPEKSDAGGDERHSISHRSRHSGSRPRSRAGSSSDQAVSATDAR